MHAWPFFDLRLRTPLLELRLPTDSEVQALGDAAVGRMVAAGEREFLGPWAQLPAGDFQRGMLQHQWALRAGWKPRDWRLNFYVFPKGEATPVGAMDLAAREFALSHSVSTGSWLLPQWRGRGFGKQMRTAVLHFAFADLEAVEARSSAHSENEASHGVSRSLGYRTDGSEYHLLHGYRVDVVRLALTADDFRPACPVEVEGAEECLALLGALPDGVT